MNWNIVNSINKQIPDEEGVVLWNLGDLFYGKLFSERPLEWLKSYISVMKGKNRTLNIVLGNHDKQGYYIKDKNYGNGDLTKFFVRVADLFDAGFINSDTGKESTITLCHYPLMSWYRKGYGSLMIHGHTHGNLDAVNDASPDLRVDVGWDGKLAKEVGSFLVPIEKVIEHMKQKAGGDDFRSYVQNKCNVI